MNPHFRISQVRIGYQLGWSFTPLSGKVPKLRAWPSLPREPLFLALKWARLGNIGLRTGGPSGIVVIDLDENADTSGLNLPDTVTVLTARGKHLYYRCNRAVRNSCGKLGPHIDVRGDGGQVVFPGSVHPQTGSVYQWASWRAPGQVELAILPDGIE